MITKRGRDVKHLLRTKCQACREPLHDTYAASDPDGYAEAMREILGKLGVQVTGAHRAADPLAALARADAVFVGGGNAFRLLRAVQRSGLLTAIGSRVRAGMPYLGVSAGANLACPTIRTTNDMPIVQPSSLSALGLVPFQVNPHYPAASSHDGPLREARDRRLGEFLEENDVPVLGLCEGSWLQVSGTRATLFCFGLRSPSSYEGKHGEASRDRHLQRRGP